MVLVEPLNPVDLGGVVLPVVMPEESVELVVAVLALELSGVTSPVLQESFLRPQSVGVHQE